MFLISIFRYLLFSILVSNLYTGFEFFWFLYRYVNGLGTGVQNRFLSLRVAPKECSCTSIVVSACEPFGARRIVRQRGRIPGSPRPQWFFFPRDLAKPRGVFVHVARPARDISRLRVQRAQLHGGRESNESNHRHDTGGKRISGKPHRTTEGSTRRARGSAVIYDRATRAADEESNKRKTVSARPALVSAVASACRSDGSRVISYRSHIGPSGGGGFRTC